MAEINTSAAPIVIIMAGGSGSRFWPLSSPEKPKQYLNLNSHLSLIQETVNRSLELTTQDRIFIASGEDQYPLLKEQLPHIKNLILEPRSKNTAACLMLATAHLLNLGFASETSILVFPADHCIQNPSKFSAFIKRALPVISRESALLTFGIQPHSAHTGYGYIEGGTEWVEGIFKTNRFVEKPDKKTAEIFIKQKNFFWNSGIFAWSLKSISEAFERFIKKDWDLIKSAKSPQELEAVFKGLQSEPIDKAVLEKADNVFVIPVVDSGWSDLGSWGAIHELKASEPEENVISNPAIFSRDVKGCLIQIPSHVKCGLVGLKNLVIIMSNDSLLILDKSNDQIVKEISQFFSEKK